MNRKQLQAQLSRFYKTHQNCKDISSLIGCSREYFYNYIDKLLIEPMNSINTGIIWDFDHIVPIQCFSLDQYNLAYNYQNIIPMFKEDNKLKGGSIHFSIELLNRLPRTDINIKLLQIANNELIRYNKYLEHISSINISNTIINT
jgi:hypothetical protein